MTAVIDIDKRYAAFCMDSLTGFQVGCKMLESVAPRKLYRVVILSIFLTLFTWHSYLDSVLSAFIIWQCFKIDGNNRKYRHHRTVR